MADRVPSQVQAVAFPKNAWRVDQAKAWLKAHGFRYGTVEETDNFFRFRQHDPGAFSSFGQVAQETDFRGKVRPFSFVIGGHRGEFKAAQRMAGKGRKRNDEVGRLLTALRHEGEQQRIAQDQGDVARARGHAEYARKLLRTLPADRREEGRKAQQEGYAASGRQLPNAGTKGITAAAPATRQKSARRRNAKPSEHAGYAKDRIQAAGMAFALLDRWVKQVRRGVDGAVEGAIDAMGMLAESVGRALEEIELAPSTPELKAAEGRLVADLARAVEELTEAVLKARRPNLSASQHAGWARAHLAEFDQSLARVRAVMDAAEAGTLARRRMMAPFVAAARDLGKAIAHQHGSKFDASISAAVTPRVKALDDAVAQVERDRLLNPVAVVFVEPVARGCWVVYGEGVAERIECRSKPAAMASARAVAKALAAKRRPAEVRVVRLDGTVQASQAYGPGARSGRTVATKATKERRKSTARRRNRPETPATHSPLSPTDQAAFDAAYRKVAGYYTGPTGKRAALRKALDAVGAAHGVQLNLLGGEEPMVETIFDHAEGGEVTIGVSAPELAHEEIRQAVRGLGVRFSRTISATRARAAAGPEQVALFNRGTPGGRTKNGRVRWQRGSVDSAIGAATTLASGDGKPRYVFPTALGLDIAAKVPPLGLKHYVVRPDGTVAKGGRWDNPSRPSTKAAREEWRRAQAKALPQDAVGLPLAAQGRPGWEPTDLEARRSMAFEGLDYLGARPKEAYAGASATLSPGRRGLAEHRLKRTKAGPKPRLPKAKGIGAPFGQAPA